MDKSLTINDSDSTLPIKDIKAKLNYLK